MSDFILKKWGWKNEKSTNFKDHPLIQVQTKNLLWHTDICICTVQTIESIPKGNKWN